MTHDDTFKGIYFVVRFSGHQDTRVGEPGCPWLPLVHVLVLDKR